MSKLALKKQAHSSSSTEFDSSTVDQGQKATATASGPRDESDVMFAPPAEMKDPHQELATQAKALGDADLNKLLLAVRGEVRKREELRSASRPQVGSLVKIIGGGGKHVGKIGTAVIVRRSRCFVTIPDVSSPAYVLISDLEPVAVS